MISMKTHPVPLANSTTSLETTTTGKKKQIICEDAHGGRCHTARWIFFGVGELPAALRYMPMMGFLKCLRASQNGA